MAPAGGWHRSCKQLTASLHSSFRELIVLDLALLRILARITPGLVPAATLHRRALAACAAGRFVDAEQWFEAAADGYRRSWQVEPMARLRVHQRMARTRAIGDPVREAEAMLEIVRALNRLDRLESMQAPFELMDAREVLSNWLTESAPADGAPVPAFEPAEVAAAA